MAIVNAIGATHRIAIGDNGAFIGANGAFIGAIYCRHWRQWRQMIHSPNLMTLLPRGITRDSIKTCSSQNKNITIVFIDEVEEIKRRITDEAEGRVCNTTLDPDTEAINDI